MGKAMSFEDLLGELPKWMVVLINRGVNEKDHESNNNINSDGKHTANINTTTSMANHITNSPPKQQTTIHCGICNSFHETFECQSLINLSVDDRVKKLGEKGLCFHCFQRGHIARDCVQRPVCSICHKPHNTLMHKRKTIHNQGEQTSQSSPRFQPFMQNALPAQNVAPQAQNVAPQAQNVQQNAIPFQPFAALPAQISQQMTMPPPQAPTVESSAPPAATHPII